MLRRNTQACCLVHSSSRSSAAAPPPLPSAVTSGGLGSAPDPVPCSGTRASAPWAGSRLPWPLPRQRGWGLGWQALGATLVSSAVRNAGGTTCWPDAVAAYAEHRPLGRWHCLPLGGVARWRCGPLLWVRPLLRLRTLHNWSCRCSWATPSGGGWVGSGGGGGIRRVRAPIPPAGVGRRSPVGPPRSTPAPTPALVPSRVATRPSLTLLMRVGAPAGQSRCPQLVAAAGGGGGGGGSCTSGTSMAYGPEGLAIRRSATPIIPREVQGGHGPWYVV